MLSTAPLREDGVIRTINKVYKPEKIFQSETSEEVEAAWEGWLTGESSLELKSGLSVDTVDRVRSSLDPANRADKRSLTYHCGGLPRPRPFCLRPCSISSSALLEPHPEDFPCRDFLPKHEYREGAVSQK